MLKFFENTRNILPIFFLSLLFFLYVFHICKKCFRLNHKCIFSYTHQTLSCYKKFTSRIFSQKLQENNVFCSCYAYVYRLQFFKQKQSAKLTVCKKDGEQNWQLTISFSGILVALERRLCLRFSYVSLSFRVEINLFKDCLCQYKITQNLVTGRIFS